MKMFRAGFLLLVLLACTVSSRHALAWPFVYRTGVTVYSPTKAYNCYTLFAPLLINVTKEDSHVYLINMNGEVVHRWNVAYPPLSCRLLPNGHLVLTALSTESPPGRPGAGKLKMGGSAGWLMELDWESQVVFKHKDLKMHHDFLKLSNGNYLYMNWEAVPREQSAKVRGGLKDTEHPGGLMFNDVLLEINPHGKTVWSWHANAHLDPDKDIIGPAYKRNEWCHGDSLEILPDGNILMASRSLDSLLVIERQTGRVKLRWGNPSYLDPKTGELVYIIGPETLHSPHDVRVVPPGCPGAGRITCYDSRANTGDYLYSRVAEIDLKTGEVFKSATPFLGRRQLSDFLGGAQRLPNGNTLECDGANGDLFQTTPDGSCAWEYINPYMPSVPLRGAIFRALAYNPDYCPQFAGLKPARGEKVAWQPLDSTTAGPAQAAVLPYNWLPSLFAVAAALAASLGVNLLLWRRGNRPGS